MDARPTPADIIVCYKPSVTNPNNANNANNFSYEKVSISYDVVRTVIQAVVAMPKHLLARRLAYSIREAARPATVPGPLYHRRNRHPDFAHAELHDHHRHTEDAMGACYPHYASPNNPNNPNNFSYEKVSVSYDVVRTVFGLFSPPTPPISPL